MNKLTTMMVDHLNLKLEKEGTALRYVISLIDGNSVSYELTIIDKYVSNRYTAIIDTTDEFETMVRMFFQGYGVESTGFRNTVKTLITYDETK